MAPGPLAPRWTAPGNVPQVRIARFTVSDQIAYGVVDGDDEDVASLTVNAIDGHPFAPFERTSARFALHDVRLLPPVLPNKLIGIGKNYADHAREMGGEAPSTPVMFLKPSTSVIGPGESVVLPPQSQQVEFEGEIAVVIGRLAKDVPPGPGRGRGARVLVRQRRHCPRPAAQRRAVDQGQGFRHVLSARAVDRHRRGHRRACSADRGQR